MPGWRYSRLIAHRCGGALAPENTLAGLHIAARLGVAAVEFDVMLSADGVPVLMHDESLERTTNGQGLVAATSLAELLTLDAGAYHHRAFVDEGLPTLAQALAVCDALNLAANVEIKPTQGLATVTGATVAAVAASSLPRAGLLLSSFAPQALLAARDLAPELPRALLVESIPADWVAQLDALACMAVHADARQLDALRVRELVAAGVPLACYTVNRRQRAEELYALGVASVFSDRCDLF
jgi:glycerophosphoryl diester phosphodiesterase